MANSVVKTVKNKKIRMVASIATQNGNHIAISEGEYGKYHCYWIDENKENPKIASIEQWVWATTWGTPIDHTEFDVILPLEYTQESGFMYDGYLKDENGAYVRDTGTREYHAYSEEELEAKEYEGVPHNVIFKEWETPQCEYNETVQKWWNGEL